MRKQFARFLALMLVLCLMPFAALAEDAAPAPEENPVVEDLTNTPSSLVALGGQLFAVSGWDGIFQKVDGGWKRALSFATETGGYDVLAAVAAEDTLYVMVRDYSGESAVHAIMTTHLEDGALAPLTKVADVDFGIGEDYYPQLYGMAADKDNVWFLLYPESGEWNNNDLYRVTLSDGKATKLTREHLTGLTAYTEDKLLAVYFDYEAENEADRGQLVSVSKETGAIEKLCSLPASYNYVGLTYDSASGYAYIADDSHLYRFDSTFAEATLCAYLPPHSSDSSASGTIFDGMYYLPDWSENTRYTACTVDPALLPSRVLRMNYLYGSDELLRAFCKEHPEIAVETGTSNAYTAEEISRAMTSGDNSADIFSLYLSNGAYEALRRKGYCYDLSGSEILSSFASRMYPHFSKVLMQDAKLCAIPAYVNASTLGYFPKAFEKVGLTEEDVPATMMEMLDFIQMWVDDYADEYPEMMLFEGAYNLREQLFSTIFQMQISYCDSQGETLTFDTPVIRKLLTRLEEIGPALKSMEPEDTEGGMVFYSDDPTALFTTWADVLPDRYGNHREWNGYPMLLALDEGMTPALSMSMSAFIVNPNSENLDLAVTFLEYMVEHMGQADKITLLPDENEPYQYEYYEENLKILNESLDMTTKALETAAEEDKAMFEEQLNWLKEDIERTEKERWAISAEDIAEYRETAQYLTILSTDMFSGANNEASNLMQRYIDGQMGAEQFIKEFSRIIRMIQMENQ